MSPEAHYAEAEKLLAIADRDVSANWEHGSGELKADILAAAQVHATLALASSEPKPRTNRVVGA